MGPAVRPAVDLLVLPQRSQHGEARLADVALERPLPRVGAQVVLQPGRASERAAADVAGEPGRGVVLPLVILGLFDGGEMLLTQEAAESSFFLQDQRSFSLALQHVC